MSAGLWVAAALLLGTGVTYIIEQRMLERTSIATLDYYQSLTRYLITDEDFVRPKTGEAYERFDGRENTRPSAGRARGVFWRSTSPS
ncbi:MAG: hypothetical protein HYT85_11865 [candidate division NC10 bacterium]|nr:hypothetical protein [candidate division NC10 bacterium]